MDFHPLLQALILGLVEGFTEFLPISSTGHLILAGDLLHFNDEKGKLFEIVIQSGAILAVCWEYRERLLRVIGGLATDRSAQRFAINIAIAFVPLAVLGPAVRQGDQGQPVQSGDRGDHLHPRRLRHPLGRAARTPRPRRKCRGICLTRMRSSSAWRRPVP
jgi:hypothetical protein